jgi:hypothetical protein
MAGRVNYDGLKSAVWELAKRGHDRFAVVLHAGTLVEVPMGEDNAELMFEDRGGFVTFMIGGRPRTTAIRLGDIEAVRPIRPTLVGQTPQQHPSEPISPSTPGAEA